MKKDRPVRPGHDELERMSHALAATLLCRASLTTRPPPELDSASLGATPMRTIAMAHLVDKQFVERANAVLLLSVLWGAFAACVIGALVHDISYWFGEW
jgi:hypothetical protein